MGKRKQRPLLTWIYDTREQRPYDLAMPDPKLFDDGGYLETALGAGDITVELDGERIPVVIERKSQGDFVGCCRHSQGCKAHQIGNDPACGARCRFERELGKLAGYQHTHVIIEAPFSLLRNGYPRSLMSGLSVVNSIACWATRFPSVHWWPVTNRVEGRIWAWTLLHEHCKHFLGDEQHGDSAKW